MFQVISSLLPVSNLKSGKNSQKIAKNRFKSYNSTANFSIFKIRIFRINRACKAGCKSAKCFLQPPFNGSAGQPSGGNTPWNKLFHKNTAFASSFKRGHSFWSYRKSYNYWRGEINNSRLHRHYI